MPRWVGVAASVAVLVIVAGTVMLNTVGPQRISRVGDRIPGLASGPVPTVTPAGLVISLADLPESGLTTVPAPTTVPSARPAGTPTTANGSAQLVGTNRTDGASAAAPVASPPRATPSPPAIAAAMPESVAITAMPAPTAPTAPPVPPLPRAVLLQPMNHWFQTLNNCSGAATSMAVSYFGLPVDPLVLNTQFRPNQGDKSVDPAIIVEYLESRGLKARVMEGGTVERMKRLVAVGTPVIAIQWLKRADGEVIGHYRVVRGYDDAKQVVLVNDSMIGAAHPMPYAEFDDLWGFYNFRYIPVWNDKLAPAVMRVLGEDMERETNVRNALAHMQERVAQQPGNAELQFGLGGAYFVAGDDERALEQYRKARGMGLFRATPYTIWYQHWPVTAMVNRGEHDEALRIAQESIGSAKTFAEMRHERGRVFEARGEMNNARREFRAALVDDPKFRPAKDALSRIGG